MLVRCLTDRYFTVTYPKVVSNFRNFKSILPLKCKNCNWYSGQYFYTTIVTLNNSFAPPGSNSVYLTGPVNALCGT